MSEQSSLRSSAARWVVAGVVVILLLTAYLVHLEIRGPRPWSGPAPRVSLIVRSAPKAAPLQSGAHLSENDVLFPSVKLAQAAKVSLVHIDVGHGMEALLLNVPMAAGTHAFQADGGAYSLSLQDMSGRQTLAAVAAKRNLIQDEALSAGRNDIPPGVGISVFKLRVKP